jgi:hypothetical protein
MPRKLSCTAASPIQEALNRRFFIAVERLTADGVLHSLSGFADECGLHASRYRELRLLYGIEPTGKQSRYMAVETEALYYLVTRYHVSARWLLTGKGNWHTK